jgi:hypothetical protein
LSNIQKAICVLNLTYVGLLSFQELCKLFSIALEV